MVQTMDVLGYINAEGGPLVVVDRALVPLWKGIGRQDYDRVCTIFNNNSELEGAEIGIGGGKGIIWEMKGADTADVLKHSESHMCIVRTWLHDGKDSSALQAIADEQLSHDHYIGDLLVESGRLVVLWAP